MCSDIETRLGGRMFYEVDADTIRKERQKAKDLKKSRWWQNLIQNTACYYCGCVLTRADATMDHVVPISRGGKSTQGNLVPACKECNVQKRSLTAVEWQDYLEGFRSRALAEGHEVRKKQKKEAQLEIVVPANSL